MKKKNAIFQYLIKQPYYTNLSNFIKKQQKGSSIGPPKPNQQQQSIIQQQKYYSYNDPYSQYPPNQNIGYENPSYPPQYEQQQYPPQYQQTYPPQQYPQQGPPHQQQQLQQQQIQGGYQGPPPPARQQNNQGGFLNELYNGIQDIMHQGDGPYNEHPQYPHQEPYGQRGAYNDRNNYRERRSRSRDRRSRSRDHSKKYPSNISDGDWNCTNCDNWNFARRQECNKCSSLRRTNQGEVYFGGAQGGPPKRGEDRGPPRRNDFRRDDNRRGGRRNDSRDRRDNRRDDRRDYRRDDRRDERRDDRRDDRRRDDRRRENNGRQGGKGPQISEGDWTCGKCKNINFKSRNQCNRCHESKNDVCEKVHRGSRSDSQNFRGGSRDNRPYRKGSQDGANRSQMPVKKEGDWQNQIFVKQNRNVLSVKTSTFNGVTSVIVAKILEIHHKCEVRVKKS
ncbi:hypothetical protein PPERSA_05383 [Pseudocohnilembus persalinus]|uniref:RanBP2-type domain-containing protein n=1 Tax=Pseudocohnilembus persalinus TaxID=266149 RepID=A0A0V0R7V5_PSEPJ|nr:hypothetical protein PPERSA_05383 [Pseudocohnilembus persalinus]|eukprot:KRX10563.1 hypothetical protein PPERSA_05383 [Pseudocohnilembus persalinus]